MYTASTIHENDGYQSLCTCSKSRVLRIHQVSFYFNINESITFEITTTTVLVEDSEYELNPPFIQSVVEPST